MDEIRSLLIQELCQTLDIPNRAVVFNSQSVESLKITIVQVIFKLGYLILIGIRYFARYVDASYHVKHGTQIRIRYFKSLLQLY